MTKLEAKQIKDVNAGAGGFFKQANEFMKNAQDLIKGVRELQGQFDGGPRENYQETREPQGPPPTMPRELKSEQQQKELPPPPAAPQVTPEQAAKALGVAVLDVAISKGWGDKTVQDILNLVGPFELNELRELLSK